MQIVECVAFVFEEKNIQKIKQKQRRFSTPQKSRTVDVLALLHPQRHRRQLGDTIRKFCHREQHRNQHMRCEISHHAHYCAQFARPSHSSTCTNARSVRGRRPRGAALSRMPARQHNKLLRLRRNAMQTHCTQSVRTEHSHTRSYNNAVLPVYVAYRVPNKTRLCQINVKTESKCYVPNP